MQEWEASARTREMLRQVAKLHLSGGEPSRNAILLPCVSCKNLFSAIKMPAQPVTLIITPFN